VIDFSLTDEQKLVAQTVRAFVERELQPYEEEVERAGVVPRELAEQVRRRALDAGLYAFNMPEELGGGGLDYVTSMVAEVEFARTSWAMSSCVARPTQILLACAGEQRERYLLPTIRGERMECFALTEPGAGSDARSIQTRAVRDGAGWVINGAKHFISHADHADYIILITVTGEDGTPRGPRPRFTTFLVDKELPGVEVTPVGCVSARGYNPHLIAFTDVRVPDGAILGEEGRGFDFATEWLYASRVMMAAHCTGRARLILELGCRLGANTASIRPSHRRVPGRVVQARRHGNGDPSRLAPDYAGGLEARSGRAGAGRRVGRQALRLRDARPRRRRSRPDLRGNGPVDGAADRALLAGR
jgi:acyl-CoA dehydrogenase